MMKEVQMKSNVMMSTRKVYLKMVAYLEVAYLEVKKETKEQDGS